MRVTVNDASLGESGSKLSKVAATSLVMGVTRGSSDAYRQNNGVAIQKRLYDTFLAAIFSNGNVDTIRAPRSLGANVLDLSDVPQDEEKRQRFWSTIREIISTRDYSIDKLPKEKRMTAYYDISRKTQEDLLRDKFQ